MAKANTDKPSAERTIANLKETLRLVTAERDEWRRLSGEWQRRAESLRGDMATINKQATQLGKTVERLQELMKS